MTEGVSILVVADDLTGANATAAGLARAGMRAVTVTSGQRAEVIAEFASRFDAVVVSTDSRHSTPAEASERVRTAIRAGWPARLVCHRIDSTLRGNVGASTAATLDEVARLSGRRAVALCVPAHPLAGRQTVGGTQLLGGLRLEETELARDPRSPITHSEVTAVFAAQTDLRVASLPLDAVTGDPGELCDRIRSLLELGTDVVVADALTVDNITRVAAAAAHAGDDVLWVGVDPGPASVALAEALGLHGPGTGAPLLAVSGSATELTRHQLARLRAERDVVVVRPDTDDRAVPDVDESARRLDAALSDAAPGAVVLLASVLEESEVVPVDHDAAEQIPRALARTVRRALEHTVVDGIFATGGDIAAALFTELAASGLDVEEELVPLAVAGSFVGGPWSGLPVVTKGGLVGDTATTVQCVDYLTRAAEARRRRVHPAQSRESTCMTRPQNMSRPPEMP